MSRADAKPGGWLAYAITLVIVAIAFATLSKEYLDDRGAVTEIADEVNTATSARSRAERVMSNAARKVDQAPEGSAVSDESAASYEAIAIPSELVAFVGNHPELGAFHGLLEQEPEDTEWAIRVEQAFRDHIAGVLGSEVIVQSVSCRTYSCEILATTYSQAAADDWLDGMSSLFESGTVNEWALGTGEGRCGYSAIGPGVFGLHCIYSQNADISDSTMPEGELSTDAPYREDISVTRIDTPGPVAEVIESDSHTYALHREIEIEPRDGAWATPLESKVVDYFTNLPELTELTISHIECRTTLCEVHMRLDDPPQHSVLLEKISDFHRDSGQEVATARMGASGLDDDSMEIVWFLRRRQP